MRGYTVHLLFHLIAIIIGGAAGLAASLWWVRGDVLASWLALGALFVGLLIVILHWFYVRGDEPPVGEPDHEQPTEYRNTGSQGNIGSQPAAHSYRGFKSYPDSPSSTRVDLEPLPEHETPQDQTPQARTSCTDEHDAESATEPATEGLNEYGSSPPSSGRS